MAAFTGTVTTKMITNGKMLDVDGTTFLYTCTRP
jgi:hypothetical protein